LTIPHYSFWLIDRNNNILVQILYDSVFVSSLHLCMLEDHAVFEELVELFHPLSKKACGQSISFLVLSIFVNL